MYSFCPHHLKHAAFHGRLLHLHHLCHSLILFHSLSLTTRHSLLLPPIPPRFPFFEDLSVNIYTLLSSLWQVRLAWFRHRKRLHREVVKASSLLGFKKCSELLINQHPQVLLLRAALNPFSTQPAFVLGSASTQVHEDDLYKLFRAVDIWEERDALQRYL